MPVVDSEEGGVTVGAKGHTQAEENDREESAAKRRLLVILRRAISVLWGGRKPNWNCSHRLLWDR